MKRLTEKTSRTRPKNAGPESDVGDEGRDAEHRPGPDELAHDDDPTTRPAVEQDADEGAEGAVGEQDDGEGDRDAPGVGGLLGIEEDVARERDLEDAVAERRRDPADEEPTETAPPQQGEQGAQEGHAAQRTVTRATAGLGTVSGGLGRRRGRGRRRAGSGDSAPSGRSAAIRAMVARASDRRARSSAGSRASAVAVAWVRRSRHCSRPSRAEGVRSRRATLRSRRIALADEHAEGEQLAHEGRNGVGGEPEHMGRLGHRDARVAPDDAQQLVLGAGERQLRQGSAHESPRPPPQQPDRVVELVSQAGHVLVAHVRRLRPSRRGDQRIRAGERQVQGRRGDEKTPGS